MVRGATVVSMRKNRALLIILLSVLSLSLTLVPSTFSQPENIKILSYSWYVDSSNNFVAVGEVQNVGSDTIYEVVLGGIVIAADGNPQAQWGTIVWVQYLVPQQRAPFYMKFTDCTSWISLGVDRVEFEVVQANVTTGYQYSNLAIKDSSSIITAEGYYWVSGSVQNTGTQTATNIRIIGTFYNASGAVVAAGFTDPLTPLSVAPSGSASFRVAAFDLNQTEVPSSLKISSYSLLIQTEKPILNGTAPSPTPSTNPTNSSSTESPDSNENGTDSSGPISTYVIVSVAVVLGIAGTTLAMRKRKSKATEKRKSKARRKKK